MLIKNNHRSIILIILLILPIIIPLIANHILLGALANQDWSSPCNFGSAPNILTSAFKIMATLLLIADIFWFILNLFQLYKNKNEPIMRTNVIKNLLIAILLFGYIWLVVFLVNNLDDTIFFLTCEHSSY